MEGGEGGLDAGVQPLAGFDRRRVLMHQPGLDAGVLACIVNLGCEIAQRRIASPAVLDRAVQLALGYPHGPLGFGDGFYADEILPIEVAQGRRQPPKVVASDEHPRPDTSLESLSRLPALFAGGVVSAGNASGVNDGAAALLLGSRAIGVRYGCKPRARILAGAIAGVEPRLMGLGPVPAIRKVLQRTGLGLADMDVIEINEAFAAQVLGCARELGLACDEPRLNPNGGAIAIGHPLGASGARLVLTALRQLERTGGRHALVSLCIGLGQGIACVIERLD
ncbi:acetyl-CoA C-acyltransferase [Azotobacter chroococcum]|nr:acetyl-CoA C-acyltransferase [Azotobacter chroococcum]